MPDSATELRVAGDLLRVQLRSQGQDASSPARPLVVVYATDGDCSSRELTVVLDALEPWCTVAAPDLPLCGARSSDKLTAAAYDSKHALTDALLSDVRLQLQDDLRVLIDSLAETHAIDRTRTAVIAWGRGAQAFHAIDPAVCGVSRVDCLEESSTDTSRLEHCAKLRAALIA